MSRPFLFGVNKFEYISISSTFSFPLPWSSSKSAYFFIARSQITFHSIRKGAHMSANFKTIFLFCFLAISLFGVISCSKKEKQSAAQQEPATQAVQQAPQPAPAAQPAPVSTESSTPKSEPVAHYDYTDIKDIAMDGSAAIGKTAKMEIMMDYTGIDNGTFRAYACENGELVQGSKNFRMSFGPSTKAAVRNLTAMKCSGGAAVFKITGKGRLEDYTAKLIELSVY